MSANRTDFDLAAEVSRGVRSLFYMIPPSESTFPTVNQVPKYVERTAPYFIMAIMLETLILLMQGRKKEVMRWNDAISSLSAGLITLLPQLLIRNIEITTYIYVFENYHIYELPYDSAWTWILCMLGVDLGYYWVHRFAHEINYMWAAHQVHHSSEDYNLNTALRQSALQKYNSWIFYIPLALFIPPSQFAVHIEFNLLYQFWIHTNIVHKLGPLEWVLNTPSHHRVHHGRNRYCIDKNYAGVLIIWDRMFGTFVEEKDDDDIAYGLVHPICSWDPIYTQLCHWKYMFETAWKMEGLGNKLSVFLKGPGWTPGKPRLGLIEDIPDIHAPQPRYDKHLSWGMTFYTVVHFFLTIIFLDFAGRNKEAWSFHATLFIMLFLLWTLFNVGWILEHKWFAPLTELVRCLIYLAVDSYLCSISDVYCPKVMLIPRVLFFCSSALWLIQCSRLLQKTQEPTKKLD